PGNVALAVHPELSYCLVKTKTGEKFWLATSLKEKIFAKEGEILKTIKGEKLVDLKYKGPFDEFEAVKVAFKQNSKTFHTVVLSKEYVNDQEGTGIVHIAPGCGEEDFHLGKEKNLPVIPVIDEEANYLRGFGDLVGKNAKENPDLILNHPLLKKCLFKITPYTHRYPVCWRCKTELVWRVVDEWYIAMDPFREKIKKVAKKIRWIPEWGLDMELDWLTNMKDWLISKKRYWGLALPIWECQKCGHFEVIGSKEELKKKAVEGWEEFEGHSPHRPWVDKVKIRCPECGSLVSRIPDVGNPWLDAGIVPFSTLVDPKTKKVSYLTDKKYWREWFPADFVTECYPGQFKNWFYSLLAMSTVLENKPPFKNLLGHALVRDEKGEEMHKSKGNAIAFDEAADKIGVDVMRWMYCRQNPEINLNFGYHVANEVRRRFHLLLWNVYNFYATYAKVDKWVTRSPQHATRSQNVLDRWIISRLNQVIKGVTEDLDNFNAFAAAQKIEAFVNDLSTWYVRRSRDRVGPTAPSGRDKRACYQTLWYVLVTLSKVLAPFIPFLSEEIFKNLTGKESVHLEIWPKAGYVNHKLLAEMELVRKICELGHAERKRAGIKVRQPLSELRITNCELRINKKLINLIKEELNVKNVQIKYSTGKLGVKLDTKITQELKEEGETRELVRRIQELRKEAGCRLDEKIIVYGPNLPANPKLQKYLKKETLAKELRIGKELKIVRLN
ncbi:MAG: class I tRNA ligase family protein, partial [Microgenomates group bacterium]